MDLNRNQFFFIGLVVLLVGIQVRYVSAYVLSPEATQFLAERTGQAPAGGSVFSGVMAGSQKVLQPPEWLFVVSDICWGGALPSLIGNAATQLSAGNLDLSPFAVRSG